MSQPGVKAIELSNVKKTFGATVAVDDVSFSIAPGTVHALLGENGAGKSTVVKLLSGLLLPDAGSISIFGETVKISSPRVAHRFGVETAFQEMTLIDDLTVLDNMLAPYAPVGLSGMIKRRQAARSVAEHFAELGFEQDLEADVGDLDLAVQQKIEIARALYRKPKILLLDEPTSTLAGRDVDWLGDIIAKQKVAGVTIVFISHRMPEVRRFCDGLTIMRNGAHITTDSVDDVSDQQVIELIVGRTVDQTYPERRAVSFEAAPEVLSVKNLAAGEKLRDGSFNLRKGEILGIAGLQGMGQRDLFLACFGASDVKAGKIAVDGREIVMTSPKDAIRTNIGIGMVPEDRKSEGLFLKLPGRQNTSLPIIDRLTSGGLIDQIRESEGVADAFRQVNIDQRAHWASAGAFSGGNQQKIVLAKWLFAQSRILLLFDPTRGIDVGTKHEIYLLMRAYVEQGGAILFHSTETPELEHLSDRVIVLYGGRTTVEIGQDELSESAIISATLGGAQALDRAS